MSDKSSLIRARLEAVTDKIGKSAAVAGRSRGNVLLVVVTKKKEAQDVNAVINALTELGLSATIGENYVQEYRDKKLSIVSEHSCHLIGALQRNKCDMAVSLFDCIESVHSPAVAAALAKAARKAGKTQRILLQVNISADPAKSGFLPHDVLPFLEQEYSSLECLQLEGLMTITRDYESAELARPDFRAMRELRNSLLALPQIAQLFYRSTCELSMGMSSDFEVAIEEGASIVRIGSAILGERQV